MIPPPPQFRALPHSIETEECLLSCCLLDGSEAVAKCVEAGITPVFFYDAAHQAIFDKLTDLFARGTPIDLAVLAAELKIAQKLDDVGGYAKLIAVSGGAATTLQLPYFIQRVKEFYALREFIHNANRTVDACYAYEGGGVAECVSGNLAKMIMLSSGATDTQEKDWDAVVEEGKAELKFLIENNGKKNENTIPFPWARMNSLFGEMARGQLVVVAARPSVGKSSFARPLLVAAVKSGAKAYFVTLEVNPRRVPMQIASSLAGIGLRQVATATANDQRDAIAAVSSLKGMGVTISSKDRSIARITARARALKAKGNLDIMFIDHGGCVQEVFGASEGGKLGAIELLTKSLKALAVDLNIVVVLLWQLNRESAKQGNREPTVTDLKACGSLEEDADKVILIHRPDSDPLKGDLKQSESMTTLDLPRYYQNIIQAKGRDDGTSLMSFYFHRETATFIPASQDK